jgi:hypothetical protein
MSRGSIFRKAFAKQIASFSSKLRPSLPNGRRIGVRLPALELGQSEPGLNGHFSGIRQTFKPGTFPSGSSCSVPDDHL